MRCRLLSLLVLALVAFQNVHAEGGEVARLYSKQGTVEGRIAPDPAWTEAAVGMIFKSEDSVRVGKHGRAGILFVDGVLVRLSNNASIQFKPTALSDKSGGNVELNSGDAWIFSRKPEKYPVIQTPMVTAAIRGTEAVIRVRGNETVVSVIDGAVECRNEFGSAQAGKGEELVTAKGHAPVKRLLVNPTDAVQWAIQYPSVVELNDLGDISAGLNKRDKEAVSRSVRAYNAGDNGRALSEFDTLEAKAGGSLAAYGASLALSMGEVDRATAILDQASGQQQTAQARGSGAALRSIIALTHNKNEDALTLSEQALALNPDSTSAVLARSYVLQGALRFDEARALLMSAVKANPQNAALKIRLAEIELGYNNVEGAEALLNELPVKEASGAYAETLRGFIYLLKQETEKAEGAFTRAIAQDSAFALPRLGLGLTRMRQEDVTGGRMEIQQAVHLDPTVSQYRSYLGKAFFEEEKEDLAGEEYDHAIKLDPKDPTPYLYRSFNQLSQNRVVDALRDVERSIELNQNRAVYRSTVLLDQDLGVRSAGLAQIFNELGFSEAARIEAIKSINHDYGNYSAHRLLGDSYDAVAFADAGFSEREIAELLSPLSFNLFSSVGGEPSFQDYNALFDKNEERTGIEVSGDTREDLYAGEIFRAGKTDKFGYYASYVPAYGNGTKNNDYFRDNRIRFAGQYQPVYTDRFILDGSYQYRDINDSKDSVDESEFIGYDVGGGFNHIFSPQSKVIGQIRFDHGRDTLEGYFNRLLDVSAISEGEIEEFQDTLIVREMDTETVKRFRTGSQHIYDTSLFTAVTGFQVYYADVDREEASLIIDDDELLFPDINRYLRSRGQNDLSSQDVYNYTTFHLAPWVDVTAGVSYAHVETEMRELTPFINDTHKDNKVSPKAGLTFYPLPSLTFRAAYFEELRKSSLEDQASIEPTLVGGINQRFNDLTGAASRNLGFGADYKYGGWTYLGAEYTRRYLTEFDTLAGTDYTVNYDTLDEQTDNSILEVYDQHVDQDLARGYVYQVLHRNIVATGDYFYNRSEVTDIETYGDLETNGVALGMRYFDPSGFFLLGRGTWREQDRTGSLFFEDGRDDFWLLDAAIGYRLPKRHGTIALEFLNILDKDFEYDQSLAFERFVAPEFGARLVAAFNF